MKRIVVLRLVPLVAVAASGALALSLAPACMDDATAFQCGTTNSGSLQTCNRPGEICDCKTNSCAMLDPTCDGGYRYSGHPFAQPDLAGACANLVDPSWVIPAGVVGICPLSPDGAITFPDAGESPADGSEPGDTGANPDDAGDAGSQDADAEASPDAADSGAPDADGSSMGLADASNDGSDTDVEDH
jgi:hypothetical protein